MNQLNQWRYNKAESTPDSPVYSHTFIILKYNKIPIISGELTWYKNDNKLYSDVYDVQNSSLYAPYYNKEYGNYDAILKKIENIILKEIKSLGLEVQSWR